MITQQPDHLQSTELMQGHWLFAIFFAVGSCNLLNSTSSVEIVNHLNAIRDGAPSKETLGHLVWDSTLESIADEWNSQCTKSSSPRNKVLYSEVSGVLMDADLSSVCRI